MESYERIKIVRKALKLSQEEFSERLKVNRSYLSQIETGRVEFIDRWVHQISLEFGVNERWLLTGDGNMFQEMVEPSPRETSIAYLTSIIESLPKEQQEEVIDFIVGLAKNFTDNKKNSVPEESRGTGDFEFFHRKAG